MIDKSFYSRFHEAKEKPETDESGFSDLVAIFTTNGECETAFYDKGSNLWYSSTDPTGFNNVLYWSPFVIPDKFELDEETYYGGLRGAKV